MAEAWAALQRKAPHVRVVGPVGSFLARVMERLLQLPPASRALLPPNERELRLELCDRLAAMPEPTGWRTEVKRAQPELAEPVGWAAYVLSGKVVDTIEIPTLLALLRSARVEPVPLIVVHSLQADGTVSRRVFGELTEAQSTWCFANIGAEYCQAEESPPRQVLPLDPWPLFDQSDRGIRTLEVGRYPSCFFTCILHCWRRHALGSASGALPATVTELRSVLADELTELHPSAPPSLARYLDELRQEQPTLRVSDWPSYLSAVRYGQLNGGDFEIAALLSRLNRKLGLGVCLRVLTLKDQRLTEQAYGEERNPQFTLRLARAGAHYRAVEEAPRLPHLPSSALALPPVPAAPPSAAPSVPAALDLDVSVVLRGVLGDLTSRVAVMERRVGQVMPPPNPGASPLESSRRLPHLLGDASVWTSLKALWRRVDHLDGVPSPHTASSATDCATRDRVRERLTCSARHRSCGHHKAPSHAD